MNVLGLYFTAQAAAKQMIANGTKHGSIVLVASMASHIAVRDQLCSAYCGTKGAVRSMCPAIAKELAQYVGLSFRGWITKACKTKRRTGHPGQLSLSWIRADRDDRSREFIPKTTHISILQADLFASFPISFRNGSLKLCLTVLPSLRILWEHVFFLPVMQVLT